MNLALGKVSGGQQVRHFQPATARREVLDQAEL